MKRILFVLIALCLVSMTQAAIIAFNAENDKFYGQAGDNWMHAEDEDALSGVYMTAILTDDGGVGSDPVIEANIRYYSFDMPAGTYNLYMRVNIQSDWNGQGQYNNDSIHISNDSLAVDAGMVDYNGMDDTDVDENSTVDSFGWIVAHQSYNSSNLRTYTMASDGTAYFKIAPREDGVFIDAFAFVPEGETPTTDAMNQAVLDSETNRGAAVNPDPDGQTPVDSETETELAWDPSDDPNIASITGYDIYFGTDPNVDHNAMYVSSVDSLQLDGLGGNPELDYGKDYYWRVDTRLVWDSNDISGTIDGSDTVVGDDWAFVTLPDNKVPLVTAGNDVLTAMELLEASVDGTVDDYGEGDVVTIAWTAAANAPAAAKQMVNRTSALALANLLELGYADPNLLQDWIGTDTREIGDPMVLTLKGLPADSYTWKSYHHDADATNTGVFDVTIIDSTGSTVTTDIPIGDSNSLPVGTFTTSFSANGVDDIVMIFDQQPYAGQGYNDAWFVMNGFELEADTVGGTPLYVDFGPTGNGPMSGYEAYEASHENSASFTEQSYSAFNTTVSILPTWGYAVMTDTTNNASSSSQSATLDTDWPGEYLVTLSATDSAMQTGSDTLIVTVAADACEAAQLSTSWVDFNESDFNEDCDVNLSDFALMASEWLDDRNLDAQE